MNKKILLIITMGFSIINSAVADQEIQESKKCSNNFSKIEKKYNIPKGTLHSISLKESGKVHSNKKVKVAWPWAANIEGNSYYFNTKKEAVTFVKQQIKDGKENIDVGCMQINLKNHHHAFENLDKAFDPKSNIDYGASFLNNKFERLQNWSKAIAHYHSKHHDVGDKYSKDVIKIADSLEEYRHTLRQYANIAVDKNVLRQKKILQIMAKKDLNNNIIHSKQKSGMMVQVPIIQY